MEWTSRERGGGPEGGPGAERLPRASLVHVVRRVEQ